jgi:hypothetical protein
MSLANLFCQGRPDVNDNHSSNASHVIQETSIDEKSLHANDEEDMQQRLSDLQREISDAKVDW